MVLRYIDDIINALRLKLTNGGILMKKSIMMLTGFLVLFAAMMLSGCAPVPYQGGPDCYVEIVYVPVPVPYPDPYPVPVYLEEPAQPSPRRKPLVRPRGPGDDPPRTKIPTGRRGHDDNRTRNFKRGRDDHDDSGIVSTDGRDDSASGRLHQHFRTRSTPRPAPESGRRLGS